MPTSKELVEMATIEYYGLVVCMQQLHQAIMRLEDSLLYRKPDYREAWDDADGRLQRVEETVRRIRQDIDGIKREEGDRNG